MPTPGQELASIDFASMLGGPLIAAVNAQAQAAMSAVNFIKEVCFKKLPVPAGEDGQDPEKAQTGDPIYVTFKYPKEVSPFTPAIPASFTLSVTVGGTGYTTPPTPTITGGGGGIGAAATATISSGTVTGLTLTTPGTGYTSAPDIVFTGGGGGTGAAATATFIAAVPAKAAVFQVMQLEVPILAMLPIPYLRIEDVTIDFNAKIDSVEYQKIDTSLKVDVALEVKQRWPGGSAKLNVSMAYQRNTQQGSSVQRTYSMAVHIKAVQDEMPAGMQKVLDILESNMRSQPVSAPTPVLI